MALAQALSKCPMLGANGPFFFLLVAVLGPVQVKAVGWETNSSYLTGIDLCTHDSPYRAPLCTQTLLYTSCALITLVFLIRKLYFLLKGISVEKYHVGIIVFGIVQCTLLSIHYSVEHKMELHLIALYCLINQFLIAVVFYGGLALKMLRRRNVLIWICYPFAVCVWAYFTVVLALACDNIDSHHRECQRIEWLLFSSSHFALAQICAIAAVILFRAMNSVRADPEYVRHKKILLGTLVVVFELSAIGNFVYDIALLYASTDCNIPALGNPNTASYMCAIWSQTLVTFFVPQWVFLVIIKPAMSISEISGVEMPSTAHLQSPARVFFVDDEPKPDTPLLH